MIKPLLMLVAVLVQAPRPTYNLPPPKTDLSSDYILQQNGDYSLKGYGSVTSELFEAGVTASGYDASTFLHIAENVSDDRAYIYVYNDTGADFDLIDLSTSLDPDNEVFETLHTFKVSYNPETKLEKYLIVELTPSASRVRRYAIRQIYSSAGKGDIETIVPVAISYQASLDIETGETTVVVDKIDFVTIPRKLTAFRLIEQQKEIYYSDYYVAFDTSVKLDNLLKVELRYDYFRFGCTTTIGKNLIGKDDKFLRNYDQFNTCDLSRDYYRSETVSVPSLIIEAGASEPVVSANGFKRKVYSWNKIERASEAENVSDETKKYEWLVHFDSFTFWGMGSVVDLVSTYYIIPWKNINEEMQPKHIDDVSILKLWYQDLGEVKTALAVDTYSHAQNETPPPQNNFWHNLLKLIQRMCASWGRFFNGKAGAIDYAYIILSVIFLFLAYFIIKAVVNIVSLLFSPLKKAASLGNEK